MSTPPPFDFEIIDVICDLIRSQLDLTTEQVWTYNQKQKIPNEPGLFVSVALFSTKPFGVTSFCGDDDAGNFCEFQSSNVQETYKIVLYSRDKSAKLRAWEAHLALTGVLSQQAQEQFCFKFAQLPTAFTDTSAVEASARLFRQDITFNAIRNRTKTRVIQYFDKFNIPPNLHVNQ